MRLLQLALIVSTVLMIAKAQNPVERLVWVLALLCMLVVSWYHRTKLQILKNRLEIVKTLLAQGDWVPTPTLLQLIAETRRHEREKALGRALSKAEQQLLMPSYSSVTASLEQLQRRGIVERTLRELSPHELEIRKGRIGYAWRLIPFGEVLGPWGFRR